MPTVYSSVLADLGPRIVDGTIPEGTVLTLDGIGATYGISRTVAREVVQVLAAMHVVESKRRTGVRILPREQWDVYAPELIRWRLGGEDRNDHLRELTQLRSAIEPASAAMAAAFADQDQRAEVVRLAGLLEATGRAGDLTTFLEHDIAFHRLLLSASGNSMFASLGDVVEEVLRGRTDHDMMPPTPKPEARKLHQMVADAVAAGEPELARAAMSAICVEVVTELDRAR